MVNLMGSSTDPCSTQKKMSAAKMMSRLCMNH